MTLKKMKKYGFIFMAAILSFGLIGCSPEEKPKAVVNELFEAIKTVDYDKISQFTDETLSDFKSDNPMMSIIESSNKSLTYKITDVKLDKDHATVKVDCSYNEVTEIFGNAMKEYTDVALKQALSGEETTDEDIDKMLADAISNAQANTEPKLYSTTVDVECVKVDGNWKIDNNEGNTKLADLLTGNLYSALKNMQDSLDTEE